MKVKKVLSVLLSVAMLTVILAGCGKDQVKNENTPGTDTSAPTEAGKDNGNTSGAAGDVKITILNTKSEIQTQWEELAEEYKELTGVGVEVSVTVGDSPSEDITKRYASGEVPTIFMGDVQDIIMLKDYALDLTNEKWVPVGGSQYGIAQDGKVIGFPFCIEARGLMYNKTVIEEITGESFDPDAVNTMGDLKNLLDKLVAGGMETPVALNKEDWSLAGHYLSQVYEEQDGTAAGAVSFTEGLKDGSVKLADNARWNSLMDTFDLLMQYNMNKADPLAADYNANAVALAEGDVAFWFNGNWAWAEMKDFALEDNEYGIMPVSQNDTSIGATDKLCGGATKYCMIDTKYNSEAQQQAAKDFLNWLVFDPAGQEFLVNDCNLVPAFSNIELEVTNPMGLSVQGYAVTGNIFEAFSGMPGDHWKTLGAEMQKYLGGQSTREELEKNIESYWQAQK
ncbi:MAG TPA: carbohydrate ABC transporter substrate-binding protein [Clostridiales bacterium]|nr:carbohydrate ABC transporter substrate-binding protein [Clostridiales bacterium]